LSQNGDRRNQMISNTCMNRSRAMCMKLTMCNMQTSEHDKDDIIICVLDQKCACTTSSTTALDVYIYIYIYIYRSACRSQSMETKPARPTKGFASIVNSTPFRSVPTNPCGQSPMDFESISLSTRTHCIAEVLPPTPLSCAS
jgi:hypothetical protein